jgi:predicted CoA-binding protein
MANAMQEAAHRFFRSPNFAVAGASQNTSKFGYRILAWYHQHALPVTPINPTVSSINLPSKSYPTVASVSKLPHPSETAVSFLTPPKVTMQILEEAKKAGVKAVWLQPGSFDEEGMKYAKENFESAVGGYDQGTVGGEGWCVLVDGEDAMQKVGREWKRQKL